MDFAALGAQFGLLLLAFYIAGTVLSMWLMYTIIWRAVRRGIREADAPMRVKSIPNYKQRGPRDW
ncbi:MAG TPA: hypothetical protein VNT53_05105 [Pseudolysinimonas sp.]|nr:hypothetical protein [Pseudolysinimonas sp.]